MPLSTAELEADLARTGFGITESRRFAADIAAIGTDIATVATDLVTEAATRGADDTAIDVTVAALTEDVSGSTAALHGRRVAVGVFNPSANAGERTIAGHGFSPTIPTGAIVTRAWYKVVTTFTSATDAGTIALGIQVDADDSFVAAVAISDGGNPWDVGFHDSIVDDTFLAIIGPLTGARNFTATVAVEALTAGKLVVMAEYIVLPA